MAAATTMNVTAAIKVVITPSLFPADADGNLHPPDRQMTDARSAGRAMTSVSPVSP